MEMSSSNIYTILKCCETVKSLNEEFKKPWGWIRFRQKRECDKLKKKIKEKINLLKDERWTAEYLANFERSLAYYYENIQDYMDEVSIPDYKLVKDNMLNLKSMYFKNGKDMIILDINEEDITFTIFDTVSGKVFKTLSVGEVSNSQAKIERICKEKIIEVLNNYLEGITSTDKELSEALMKKVYSSVNNL